MGKAKKITPKRRKLAEAYLANGFDGKAAAITAGFSEKRAAATACEILNDPRVRAYLDERMKSMQMTADEALFRLTEHGRGEIREFINLSSDEIKVHPKAWLIKKFKFKTRRLPSSIIEEYNEIEIHDPQAAINTILKQLQLASGLPTEIVSMLPTVEKFIEQLKAAGQDPAEVLRKMASKLESDHAGH